MLNQPFDMDTNETFLAVNIANTRVVHNNLFNTKI